MTDLQRALYQFAQENRVYSLLYTGRQELWEGLRREQRGIGQNAPGPTPLIKGRCPEGTEGIGTGSR